MDKDNAEYLLDLPDELSPGERNEILERARYETFIKPGVNARATIVSVLTTAIGILILFTLSAAIYLYSPLKEAGAITSALVNAMLLGVMLFVLQFVRQHYRARLLAPKVREILEQKRRDHH